MKIKIPSIKLTVLAFSVICFFESIAVLSSFVLAEEQDLGIGKKSFEARCAGCHGIDGTGDASTFAKYLYPTPRRFVGAIFKFKTTKDDGVPLVKDLLRVIDDGIPGTAMPPWKNKITQEEKLNIIAYEKSFAPDEWEGLITDEIDYSGQVSPSPESIKRGDVLYHENSRCSECHGQEARGDGIKAFKDDIFFKKLWPRNLTLPWTFRISNAPKDIFARITVGIQGTPMPSFASGPKALSNEDRWHIANYVNSIGDRRKEPKPGVDTVRCNYVDKAFLDIDNPEWETIQGEGMKMMRPIVESGQMSVRTDRAFLAKCVYDKTKIVFSLEWDDLTASVEGDERVRLISENSELYPDAVAILMPQKSINKKDEDGFIFFEHKNKSFPVNILKWSAGSVEKKDIGTIFDSNANGKIEARLYPENSGLSATSKYGNGLWKVLLSRDLKTNVHADYQFIGTTRIPVAFATWDGSRLEKDWKHIVSNSYWLVLDRLTKDIDTLKALHSKLSSYLVLKKFNSKDKIKLEEAKLLWKKEAATWDSKDVKNAYALIEWADSKH